MAASLRRLQAAGAPLPGALRPTDKIAAGTTQEILTLAAGLDIEMPARDITIGGTYTPAEPTGSELRAGPSSVGLTALHLGADGKKKGKFTIKAKIKGNDITETTKRFRGFAVKAGESVRVTMSPKGGDFEPGDQVSFSLRWVEP